jgi:hypothetical protein
LQHQQREQQQLLQSNVKQQLVGHWTSLLQGTFQQRMLPLYGAGWQQSATVTQQLYELCKVEASMATTWPVPQQQQQPQQQGGEQGSAFAPVLHLQQQLLVAQVSQQLLGVQEAFPGREQDAGQMHAWLQELRSPFLQNLATTAATNSRLGRQEWLSTGLLASQLVVEQRKALRRRKGQCW